MTQKYDVYVAGKPLRFFIGAPEEVLSTDLPIVQVKDHEELRRVVERLNAGTDRVGAQLIASPGFDAWDAFSNDHIFVLAAGGLVQDETGRLLAIRRLGMWDLPKGKVEESEDIDAAAMREVQEECGLERVELLKPVVSTWHTYERKGKQYLKRTDWFHMRASSAETLTAQVEEDIEEVRWLDAEGLRLMEADTYPSLLPVLSAWKELSIS